MADFELRVETDSDRKLVRLKLFDSAGSLIGSNDIDLSKHSPALWEGLFDQRYIQRHEDSVAEFLGREALGRELFDRLSGPETKSMAVRSLTPDDEAAFARIPWAMARFGDRRLRNLEVGPPKQAPAASLVESGADPIADGAKLRSIADELESLRLEATGGGAEAALPEIDSRLERLRQWWSEVESAGSVFEPPRRVPLGRALVSALDAARTANFALRRWRVCLDLLEEIEAVQRALGDDEASLARTCFHRCWPLLQLNQPDEAQRVLEGCLMVFLKVEDAQMRAACLAGLAQVWYLRGDPVMAAELGQRALAYFNTLTDPSERGILHEHLGQFFESMGRSLEAAWHRLAAASYYLMTGRLDSLRNWRNRIAAPGRHHLSGGGRDALPPLKDALEQPGFEALRGFLESRRVDTSTLQGDIDRIVDEAYASAAKGETLEAGTPFGIPLESPAFAGSDSSPGAVGSPEPADDETIPRPKSAEGPAEEEPEAESGGAPQPAARSTRPQFHALLKGESDQVFADQVVLGSEFELVFDLGATPAHALARLEGRRLDEMLDAPEAELSVLVTPPKGVESLPGEHYYKSTGLHGRRLAQPLPFGFRASPSAPPGATHFKVVFLGDGDPRYVFQLPFRLIEKLDSELAWTPPRIRLDAKEVASPTKKTADYLLNIAEEGGRWHVYRVDLGKKDGGNYPVKISKHTSAKIDRLISETSLEKVATHSVWARIPFETESGDDKIPLKAIERKYARECLEDTLRAGYKLHHALASDPPFKEVLDWIEALPDGSRLTILTDAAYLPWEILYPIQHNPDWPEERKKDSVKLERLWGCRFRISMLPIAQEDPRKCPPLDHQPGPMKIVMALDERIDEEFSDGTFRPIRFQAELAADLGEAVRVVTDLPDLKRMLLGDNSDTLIYFYCHGQSEKLVFTNGFELTEDYLDESPFAKRPIVFFNSCSAGTVSPLSYNTFLRKFIKKEALGMLGSYFPLPTRFAAAFGRRLIQRYAARESVGDALYQLRRDLVLCNEIPLGLFYSLQCPSHAKAPKGEEE